jgi:hypothetical protein
METLDYDMAMSTRTHVVVLVEGGGSKLGFRDENPEIDLQLHSVLIGACADSFLKACQGVVFFFFF